MVTLKIGKISEKQVHGVNCAGCKRWLAGGSDVLIDVDSSNDDMFCSKQCASKVLGVKCHIRPTHGMPIPLTIEELNKQIKPSKAYISNYAPRGWRPDKKIEKTTKLLKELVKQHGAKKTAEMLTAKFGPKYKVTEADLEKL